MNLLDRYILKRFLGAFVFVVLMLVAVITIIDMTEKIEKFNRNNLGASDVFGYYLDFIPFIGNLITPITTFIAVVFVTAKMAGHTEIIAILSSGVSFRRMMRPYLVGAIIIASVSFVLTGWIIPNSNKKRLAFEIRYFEKKYYYDERNIHMQVGPDTYLYMQSYNNQSNIGYRFTLERLENKELREKLSARRIEWDDENEIWKLKNWQRRELDSLRENITTGVEMDTSLLIHPSEFSSDYREYDGMTINELNAEIDKLKARGADNLEVYEVEKYIRFTSPFTVIILVFMGVIVSSRKTRGGVGFQIALGFFLAFLFILFFILSKSMAEAGTIDPAFTVWLPNIVFGSITIFMYKFVPR
ncbi:MAG: LptF/LptG family permease [Bacteroidota bacterium]